MNAWRENGSEHRSSLDGRLNLSLVAMQQIPLPVRTYQDFTDPLTKLITLARSMAMASGPVSLDLRESRFLSPLLIGGAAALVRSRQEGGVETVSAPECNDLDLRRYLELIRFPQGYSRSDDTYDTKRLLATLRAGPTSRLFLFRCPLHLMRTGRNWSKLWRISWCTNAGCPAKC